MGVFFSHWYFFNLPGSEYFVDSFKLYEIMHAAENVSTIVYRPLNLALPLNKLPEICKVTRHFTKKS